LVVWCCSQLCHRLKELETEQQDRFLVLPMEAGLDFCYLDKQPTFRERAPLERCHTYLTDDWFAWFALVAMFAWFA
jgi:hypothetical protein